MSRRSTIRSENMLTITDDTICHLSDCSTKPHISRTILGIVSSSDAIHSPLLLELRSTLIVGRTWSVNTKSPPSLAVDQREARNITRPIRNVNHVLHRHPPLLLGHKGINFDIRILVHTLVDLENCPSFAGIVNGVANLRKQPFTKMTKMFLKTGGRSFWKKFASPDAVDLLSQTTPFNHRTQSSRYNVMLNCDIMFQIWLNLNYFSGAIKEIRKTWGELDPGPQLTQLYVRQILEDAFANICQYVIEVNCILTYSRRTTWTFSITIVVHQGIYLIPEFPGIDIELSKKRILHVAVSQCLIKVPD